MLARHVLEAFAPVPDLAEFSGESVGCELGPVAAAFGFYFAHWLAVDDVGTGDFGLPGAGDDVLHLGALDHQVRVFVLAGFLLDTL